jgi:hypothetical protein
VEFCSWDAFRVMNRNMWSMCRIETREDVQSLLKQLLSADEFQGRYTYKLGAGDIHRN